VAAAGEAVEAVAGAPGVVAAAGEAEEVAGAPGEAAAVEDRALAAAAVEVPASAEVEWAAGRADMADIWAAAAVTAHFQTAATSARAAATLRVEVTSHKAARIGATEGTTAMGIGFLSEFRFTTTAITTDTTVAVAAGSIAGPWQPAAHTGGVATNCA